MLIFKKRAFLEETTDSFGVIDYHFNEIEARRVTERKHSQ